MDCSLNVLKKELESEGTKQVLEMWKNKTMNEEAIINVMKEGEKKFVETTGRYMTYLEIRQIYG
uniref:Uncharacterized protein n=1 Tax=viral metagenome TaxID=1070528 RepID=A0A6C0B374_9ZZZZ